MTSRPAAAPTPVAEAYDGPVTYPAAVPTEATRTPRPLPPWAPGLGTVITTALLSALFMLGPAALSFFLATVDAPMAMRAGAVAVGVILILAYVWAIRAVIVRRRTYRTGAVVSAQITGRKPMKVKGAQIGWRYDLAYTVEGVGYEVRAELDKLGLRALPFEPGSGDTAFVVYDPARPKRGYILGAANAAGQRWLPGLGL